MNTNKSRFNKVDLRMYRRHIDPTIPQNAARKKNMVERKNMARRTRRCEASEFRNRLLKGDIDAAGESFDR